MNETDERSSDPTPARRLLEAAGLHPSAEELAIFEALYPLLRARADAIHAQDLGDRG